MGPGGDVAPSGSAALAQTGAVAIYRAMPSLSPQAEPVFLHVPQRVVVFVLRSALPRTQCLLRGTERGRCEPISGERRPEETELQAVIRLLAGLPIGRLYALGGLSMRLSPAAANVFVAWLEAETPGEEYDAERWVPLTDAPGWLRPGPLHDAAREVLRGFVGRSPDEALRIA